MRQQERARRLDVEIQLIHRAFGEVRHARDYSWVYIAQFPMPRNVSHSTGPLLLFLPPAYPIVGPKGFCISARLQRRNRAITQSEFNGWAYFLLDWEEWQASADIQSGENLLTALDQIHRYIGRM